LTESLLTEAVKATKVKILYTYLPASSVRKVRRLLALESKRGQKWKRKENVELSWKKLLVQ
jgi:hypothetical protein